MESPRYTVIVPMAHFRPDEPVLASLRATPSPADGVQVLVAEGGHPARQRNLALSRARGDIVVFLDNDCTLGEGFWRELGEIFSRAEVEIVGGPARLRPGAGMWEQIFHALLTHALVVGTVSARYGPRGDFRPATQTDLILCNLAVRKSIFEKIGPLSNQLYPNEENEWLDRAHAAGVGAFYDPQLQVFRPQRAKPGQMFLTLMRYGIGRTRQYRVSGWRLTFHQLLPLVLLGAVGAMIVWKLEMEVAALWLAAACVIAVTCRELSFGKRIIAGLIAPMIPMTYAVGQIIGWFVIGAEGPSATSEIVLRNERGELV